MENTMAENNFKHIVRVNNVDLPGEKVLAVALTKITGVGTNLAAAICNLVGLDQFTKAGYLSEDQVEKINAILKDPLTNGLPLWMLNRQKDVDTGKDLHQLTGDLIYQKDNDKKRLMRIKSYRGLRLARRLTVRGQRTRSNFRKNKGKVASVKKKGK